MYSQQRSYPYQTRMRAKSAHDLLQALRISYSKRMTAPASKRLRHASACGPASLTAAIRGTCLLPRLSSSSVLVPLYVDYRNNAMMPLLEAGSVHDNFY